mmetsp:Transcript_30230/g.42139  ORF Transcript_30230/g.42139 Transcript_30230/m.42139 type:complete len:148 (-) Transcript_30230:428-871(-)
MKSFSLLLSVFLNICLVVVLCAFALRSNDANVLGAPATMRASNVGIGRPMQNIARPQVGVRAQPGKQMSYKDLPKAAFGGIAAAKAFGLSSVAHAAEAQQIVDLAGYQKGDGMYVATVAFNVFACATVGVILGFAMLRLEQIVTAKE